MSSCVTGTDFTLAGYRMLLLALMECGYESRGFDRVEPQSRHIILRHDVDMSLDAALRVAQIEREVGVSATYFVLPRTEFYNVFSLTGERVIRRLMELKHHVGLHFDAANYEQAGAALEDACERECWLLEQLSGRPVEIISFHRPARALMALDRPIAGRRHAYESWFTREIDYCSDSRGAWHHGHPLERAAIREGRALQLLTHPIWWDARYGETVVEKLERFALERLEYLRNELERNCLPYRNARRPSD